MPTIKNIEGWLVSVGDQIAQKTQQLASPGISAEVIEDYESKSLKLSMLKFSILYTERHIIIKTLNNIRRYLNLNRLSGRSLMSLELNQRMFSFMIFTVYTTL